MCTKNGSPLPFRAHDIRLAPFDFWLARRAAKSLRAALTLRAGGLEVSSATVTNIDGGVDTSALFLRG